jgi:hypothetical protein
MAMLANTIDVQHKVTDRGDDGSKVQFLIELPEEQQAVTGTQPQDEVSDCKPLILSKQNSVSKPVLGKRRKTSDPKNILI